MVAVFDERERVVIVTDVTPFHPRDYQWADQPADRGVIEVCGTSFPVLDAVVIAVGQGGSYYMDAEIPIKKNDPQWFFCVGHVLPRGASLSEGDEVLLSVDENYRSALSRAHSAAHIMSLALNMELSALWRKIPEKKDALGNPDFDRMAIDLSVIGEGACEDRYRLGKSLRKKGFPSDISGDRWEELERAVNARISGWLENNSAVSITRDGDLLMSFRHWNASLGGCCVSLPCGGTHVSSFSEIGEIKVTLSVPDAETLLVRTVLG